MSPKNRGELLLARCFALDEPCELGNESEADRRVRGPFLRALVTGRVHNNKLFHRRVAVGRTQDQRDDKIPIAARLMLRGATIADGLDFSHAGCAETPLPHLDISSCTIDGPINITGGVLGGGLILNDTVINDAITGRGARISGDVSIRSVSNPAIDFSGARIGGRLKLEAPVPLQAAAREAWLTLDEAEINGAVELVDVSLMGRCPGISACYASFGSTIVIRSAKTQSTMSGFHLTGATIRGDLSLQGVTLKSDGSSAGLPLKADHTEIKGDVRFKSDVTFHFSSQGTVYLNGAAIHGLLWFEGADLKAEEAFRSTGNATSLALDASGAKIRGGAFFMPGGGRRSTAQGELRFVGATISGQLRFAGAALKAGATPAPSATNTHDANVNHQSSLSLTLQSARIEGGVFLTDSSVLNMPCEIEGVVSFVEARIAHFTCRLENDSGIHPAVLIRGLMRLDRAVVSGATNLSSVSLLPEQPGTAGIPIAEAIRLHRQLQELHPRTILSAAHTEFGQRLKIRLDKGSWEALSPTTTRSIAGCHADDRLNSQGVIDLQGAKVHTLDDLDGGGFGSTKVCLDLDGFVYERLQDADRPPEPALQKVWRSIAGKTHIAEDRLSFLNRMYAGNAPTPTTFKPQPYEQLAKVLRAEGYPLDADHVACKKRTLLARCSHLGFVSRFSSLIWGFGFGHGYSPRRAACVVVLLFVIAFGFSYFAMKEGAPAPVHLAQAETADPPDLSAPSPKRTAALVRAKDGVADFDRNGYGECRAKAELFALDLMLPLVDLRQESMCALRPDADGYFHWWKAIITILGWIVVPLAALTFSGVLKRD